MKLFLEQKAQILIRFWPIERWVDHMYVYTLTCMYIYIYLIYPRGSNSEHKPGAQNEHQPNAENKGLIW